MESCCFALPFRIVGLLGTVVLVLGILALVGLRLRIAGHIERGEQFVHRLGEGVLVLDGAAELVELGARLVLDRLAPELDDASRAGRRLQGP